MNFSSKKNIIIIIISALFALGVGSTAFAIGISNTPANRVSRYMGAAERYLSEMNYEQAVIEFQRILEIEPMNVDAYLGMAEAYIAMGEPDKAIDILISGYKKTESNEIKIQLDELKKSAALKLGNQYLYESRFDDAVEKFKEVLNLDDKCVDAYIGIADAYIGLDQRSTAVENLQDGFAKTEDERISGKLNNIVKEYLTMADEYMAENNFIYAAAFYDKALQIDDKCVEAYIGSADAYLFQNKNDNAEKALRTGIDKTNDDRIKTKLSKLLADYLKNAEEFLRDKDYSNAVSCYNMALGIDEKCVEAYIGIADSYIGLEEKYNEIQILETGYEKTKDEKILRRLNDLQKIADALKRAKEFFDSELYDQAVEEYVRAQEIDPMCADAYLGEAKVYVERGDMEKAIEIMDKGKSITGSRRFNRK